MKYEFKDIANLKVSKRIIQYLGFNQVKRDNYIVLFENFDQIFISSALKDEFGIDCLDSYMPGSDDGSPQCAGFLIREEDANLLQLMRPARLVMCEEVGVIIDFYDKAS